MSDAKNQYKVGNRPKLPKLDTTMANPVNQSKDANKPKLPKLDTKMVKPIDQIKEEAASTNPTKSSTRSATSDPLLRGMQSRDSLAQRSTEPPTENKPGKSDSHHSMHRTDADSSKERLASTADTARTANGGRTQDSNSHTTTRSHSKKPRQTTTDVAKKGGLPSDASKDSPNPVGRDNDTKGGSQQSKSDMNLSRGTPMVVHADCAAGFDAHREIENLRRQCQCMLYLDQLRQVLQRIAEVEVGLSNVISHANRALSKENEFKTEVYYLRCELREHDQTSASHGYDIYDMKLAIERLEQRIL
ncbi:hypothetical protein LTR37_017490 [Vermiconidia calcicola]|uniref:Uncharacterized protein n=1 Tax=Vermiconidia calcicola TaxID=1690605 RepID=A0ACC3MJN4_9PEZI|nr:hypothetical protein LTR37_017490 [Vermiconidia calcicola]